MEKDPVIRSMPNILLSLFLLYEKYVTGDASFWKPYIDILPSSYDTVLYFSIEDMSLLKQSQYGFRESI
jgi:histone-lysine N-methyltransferase SETD3